jgi:hypothetical protein
MDLQSGGFMQKLTFIGIAALCAMLLSLAPTALAGGSKDGDAVIKRGKCTASSTWKLKAKPDDARIEMEFEVDQNRVGKRWRLTVVRNGSTVFSGIRTTVAPSGSFTARRLLAASAGTTRIVATAKALRGGETCRAVIAF